MSERKSREQVPDEEEVWACVAAIPPFVFYFFLFLFLFFFFPPSLFCAFLLPVSVAAREELEEEEEKKKEPSTIIPLAKIPSRRCMREIEKNFPKFENARPRSPTRKGEITMRSNYEKREREREGEEKSRFSGIRRFSRQEVSSKDKDKTLTQLRATRIRRRGRGRR